MSSSQRVRLVHVVEGEGGGVSVYRVGLDSGSMRLQGRIQGINEEGELSTLVFSAGHSLGPIVSARRGSEANQAFS